MHIEDESVYCGKQVTLIIHVCRIEKTLEFQYQSMVNERVTTISTQPWYIFDPIPNSDNEFFYILWKFEGTLL